MRLRSLLDEYDTELTIIGLIVLVSVVFGKWITQNYYLLEYFFAILLFGLVYEAWTNVQSEAEISEFLRMFGGESRVGMQVALLVLIGSTVYFSFVLREFIESIVGPLSVIQMFGLIVVLSRGYVNAYDTGSLVALFDGAPETYATYAAGLLAFIVSWQIRGNYPVHTEVHNSVTIFVSVGVSWLLFYHFDVGEELPSMDRSSSHKRKG